MYTSFVVFTVLSGLLSAFTRCSLSQGLHNDAMQCPHAENSGGSIHGACYHQKSLDKNIGLSSSIAYMILQYIPMIPVPSLSTQKQNRAAWFVCLFHQ